MCEHHELHDLRILLHNKKEKKKKIVALLVYTLLSFYYIPFHCFVLVWFILLCIITTEKCVFLYNILIIFLCRSYIALSRNLRSIFSSGSRVLLTLIYTLKMLGKFSWVIVGWLKKKKNHNSGQLLPN